MKLNKKKITSKEKKQSLRRDKSNNKLSIQLLKFLIKNRVSIFSFKSDYYTKIREKIEKEIKADISLGSKWINKCKNVRCFFLHFSYQLDKSLHKYAFYLILFQKLHF